MQLIDQKNCTGCGACKAICPRRAIVFLADDKGFPTPSIDSEKCVECGMCYEVCPVNNKPETYQIRTSYAAQILDKEALRQSTSGGMFTLFSREIFKRKGIVYGCVWDKQYNAVIQKAENEKEINHMRGSKYVWSWAGDCFEEIKTYLSSGREVMFTGLPCQVAGLRRFLRKDYDNLLTVDFLCSGSPSPMAFQSWLKTIQGSVNLNELDLKFRDKTQFGVGVHITYRGQNHKNIKSGEHIRNSYYYAFFIRLLNRQACYNCQYRTGERVSDLTICDYWGVSRFHKEMNVSSGISGLLVNSAKGESILTSVQPEALLVMTEAANIAQANNLSLDGVKTIKAPEYREDFFRLIKDKGWTAAERRYLYNWERIKLYGKIKLPSKYQRFIRKLIPYYVANK